MPSGWRDDEEGGDEGAFRFVPDRDERKFAALAVQAEALLVTNDRHLLSAAARIGTRVMTAGEALKALLGSDAD